MILYFGISVILPILLLSRLLQYSEHYKCFDGTRNTWRQNTLKKAEMEFRKLNEAYESIKKYKGFS